MKCKSLLPWLVVCVGLVITLGSLPSCGGGGGSAVSGGGGAVQTNDATVTVAIASGGSIEFPPGSLPKNATVTVKQTRTPVLPDYAQALGTAIAIEADAALERPAWLHLPIPANVADPTALAIFRVEADGTVTEHLTRVDGDELVAPTLGFSAFSVAEREVGNTQNTALAGGFYLVGPTELMSGETAEYRITRFGGSNSPPPRLKDAKWTYSGPLSQIENSRGAAFVQAAGTVTEATDAGIAVSLVDPAWGFRYFGAVPVRVIPLNSFNARIGTPKPTLYADTQSIESAVFTVYTVGMTPPITWKWDFGDGDTGGPVTTDQRTFTLPLKQYPVPFKAERYDVTATAQSGALTVDATTNVWMVRRPLEVSVTGPPRLQWSAPQVSAQYVAEATGGFPPYVYNWLLSPGRFEGTPGLSTQIIAFDQPGGHRLKVTAQPFAGSATSTTVSVKVEGGEALSTRMLDLPANAQAGTKVTAQVQVRGGVLMVAGKKAGYEFHFDWGDGTVVVERDVGLTKTPDQGLSIPMSHTYRVPKTYTVTAKVYDATGSSVAQDVREIAIEGDASSAFGLPTQDICPSSVVMLTRLQSAAQPAIWKTATLDDFIDHAKFPAPRNEFKAVCVYTVPNPSSEDIFTGVSLQLDYNNNPSNGLGCSQSSNFHTESGGDAYSWIRLLRVDTGSLGVGFFADAESYFNDLLDRASGAGVGAACR